MSHGTCVLCPHADGVKIGVDSVRLGRRTAQRGVHTVGNHPWCGCLVRIRPCGHCFLIWEKTGRREAGFLLKSGNCIDLFLFVVPGPQGENLCPTLWLSLIHTETTFRLPIIDQVDLAHQLCITHNRRRGRHQARSQRNTPGSVGLEPTKNPYFTAIDEIYLETIGSRTDAYTHQGGASSSPS